GQAAQACGDPVCIAHYGIPFCHFIGGFSCSRHLWLCYFVALRAVYYRGTLVCIALLGYRFSNPFLFHSQPFHTHFYDPSESFLFCPRGGWVWKISIHYLNECVAIADCIFRIKNKARVHEACMACFAAFPSHEWIDFCSRRSAL
ncbi:MAG: hypothetical protein RR653_12815, partial [Clostridia bacterium]